MEGCTPLMLAAEIGEADMGVALLAASEWSRFTPSRCSLCVNSSVTKNVFLVMLLQFSALLHRKYRNYVVCCYLFVWVVLSVSAFDCLITLICMLCRHCMRVIFQVPLWPGAKVYAKTKEKGKNAALSIVTVHEHGEIR